ncbi:hypothetical protein [Yersinia intermedia]|uniref:hypothetical protein n=1 Tax=Yersinia intermedia TaxID=631 RepID=UPI0011A6B88F|nr:hypothetical protein [Yersinia intermedia]
MNNLELSNPVAWTDADELADMDCNTYGNIFNAKYIDIHNGRWLPLYSQGYIDFLIAQLEAAQKERDELKELNCHFDLSIRKIEGVNEVLRSKLEAAERALIRPLPIGELLSRLEGQTYRKWYDDDELDKMRERAEAAEAKLLVPEGYCIMPESLTAENGAKVALSGEFFTETHITCEECGGDCDEDDPCKHCNDLGVQTVRTAIGWSTIKDIYKMAVSATAIRQAGFTVEGELDEHL